MAGDVNKDPCSQRVIKVYMKPGKRGPILYNIPKDYKQECARFAFSPKMILRTYTEQNILIGSTTKQLTG